MSRQFQKKFCSEITGLAGGGVGFELAIRRYCRNHFIDAVHIRKRVHLARLTANGTFFHKLPRAECISDTSICLRSTHARCTRVILQGDSWTRQHWTCSLRQVARALDKPLALIPARYSAVKNDLRRLHHAPLGLTPKTLANHKSNAKASLLWLTKERSVPRYGVTLTPQWKRLRAQLSERNTRYRVGPLMRFCSALGLGPEDVDEIVIDDFMAYRCREMARSTSAVTRRVLARLWNAQIGKIDGWPSRRLIEPPIKARVEPAWEDFPFQLRLEVDCYLDGLRKIRRNSAGQRLRPCKPATIECRRREIILLARRAVQLGVPIESLTSFGALLNPDVVQKVLDWYWSRSGERPTAFIIDLACHALAAARAMKCLDEQAYERLDELRTVLEDHRQTGLTDKNSALIRQVLTEGVWSRIVNLPMQLMAKARSRLAHAPIGAAVTAQIAVAIAILTVAPVRRSNLTNIRLGTNLIKPGGPDSNYWLVYPDYDVRNRVRLDYPLDDVLTKLIDEYVNVFRPAALTRSQGSPHE
jgi:hypothetical protein